MKNSEYLFVPYELALKLKEKGFNEPCLGYYVGKDKTVYTSNEDIKAPFTPDLDSKVMFRAAIYEQVIDWFDEVHKIRICLGTAKTSGKYRYDILQFIEGKWQGDYNLSSFYTRTERNIKAINEALELIEK